MFQHVYILHLAFFILHFKSLFAAWQLHLLSIESYSSELTPNSCGTPVSILSYLSSTSPLYSPQKQVAFTIDDLPMTGAGNRVNLTEIIDCNHSLLTQAQRYGVPVIGFVNEKRILVKGEMEARTDILRMWLEKGASLGNHTFSHPSLYRTDLKDFQREVIQGEVITNMVLAEQGQEMRYFRHPFLNTGPSVEVKKGFEQFLEEMDYEIGPRNHRKCRLCIQFGSTQKRSFGEIQQLWPMHWSNICCTQAR